MAVIYSRAKKPARAGAGVGASKGKKAPAKPESRNPEPAAKRGSKKGGAE